MTDALDDALARRGYVYILTNPSMPGMVKIGRTARQVDLRAAELWKTGVPTPFEVFASTASFDCVQLEAFVHAALHPMRVTKGREFFALAPVAAAEVLKVWSVIQTEQLVGELEAGLTVTPYETSVHRFEVQRLADELSQPLRVVADAIEALTADELRPAVERVRAKLAAEHPDLLQAMDDRLIEGGAR